MWGVRVWAPWISLSMWNGVAFCIFCSFALCSLHCVASRVSVAWFEWLLLLCCFLFCIHSFWMLFLPFVQHLSFAKYSASSHSLEMIRFLSVLSRATISLYHSYIVLLTTIYTPINVMLNMCGINKKRSLMQTSSLHFLSLPWFLIWCTCWYLHITCVVRRPHITLHSR